MPLRLATLNASEPESRASQDSSHYPQWVVGGFCSMFRRGLRRSRLLWKKPGRRELQSRLNREIIFFPNCQRRFLACAPFGLGANSVFGNSNAPGSPQGTIESKFTFANRIPWLGRSRKVYCKALAHSCLPSAFEREMMPRWKSVFTVCSPKVEQLFHLHWREWLPGAWREASSESAPRAAFLSTP